MKRKGIVFILVLFLIFMVYSCKKSGEKAKKTEKKPISKKEFSFTENPELSMIPDTEVKGEIVYSDGKKLKFPLKTIIIKPGFFKWSIVFAEKEITEDPATNVEFEDTIKLKVEFDTLEIKPQTILKKKASIENEDDLSFIELTINKSGSYEPVSSYTLISYIVKFDDFTVEPYKVETGSGTQLAGKASGKIAVCIKGDGEDFNTFWIAGDFKDVPVYYTGKPPWIKE